MKQKKDAILAWLSQDVKDYAEGCDLAERYGSASAANIYRHSSPKFKMGSLTAYLRKLAGVVPGVPVALPIKKAPSPDPQPIQRAKARLHEVWLKLNEYHNRLHAMGDDNSDEMKRKRVELIAERKPWLDAFYPLWGLKELYFTYPEGKRKVPDGLVEMLDALDGKSSASPEQESTMREKLAALSDLQLSKKRHAIVTAIGKYSNRLRFQQPTPSEHLDPMPDGPKRKKVEAHIEELRAQLLIVDELMKQRKL